MWTEEKLDNLLTEPSDALVEDMKKIEGDIMVLGAGGKMGPTLCVLAKNAIKNSVSKDSSFFWSVSTAIMFPKLAVTPPNTVAIIPLIIFLINR